MRTNDQEWSSHVHTLLTPSLIQAGQNTLSVTSEGKITLGSSYSDEKPVFKKVAIGYMHRSLKLGPYITSLASQHQKFTVSLRST